MQFIRSYAAPAKLIAAPSADADSPEAMRAAHASGCPLARQDATRRSRSDAEWSGYARTVATLSQFVGADSAEPCGCWPGPHALVTMPDGSHVHAPIGSGVGPDHFAVVRLLDGIWNIDAWADSEADAQFLARRLSSTRPEHFPAAFRALYGLPRNYTGDPLIINAEACGSDHDVTTCDGGLDEVIKIHQARDGLEFGQLRCHVRRTCYCDGASPVCFPEAAEAASRVLLARSNRVTAELTRGMLLALSHVLSMATLVHGYRDDHPTDCGFCPCLNQKAEILRTICATRPVR